MATSSFEKYKKSGFYKAADIAALQEHLANFQRTDAQLKADAQAAYKSEYEGNKLTYQNQLNQLGVYKNADIKKLNTQFDQQAGAVQRDLTGRGFGRSSLVSTRGVETENARNAAIAEKSLEYLEQENQINANLQQLDATYAQNVENKYVELRNKQLSDRIQLMAQISQLQSSGYAAYMNYQLNK
jgi:hypothetical protein